ncbi:LytR/AlgR family response regulator transcription factor [Salegentibacter sediminis]|uniref:LytR/AlgR family response regulator transcription factor n=1 Tax=Salegentibacter sediminis TaxID=1930251 RepID=UPI0009BCCC54|nr:LytTR family DNA-binding domain-containing protein [Salegentibacter sediminis]
MKVVIIEDENFAAQALAAMVMELKPRTKILEILPSIEETVAWFKTNTPPELIFCDIHLSDGNSFEIFNQVEVSCPVIFTTAYDQYAIEAFKVNSIDYLLKPIKKEKLTGAIAKFESLNHQGLHEQLNNFQQLLQDVQSKSKPKTKSRFMVKSGQSIQVIPTEEVAYFIAEDGIVLLVNCEGKRFAVNNSLDQLEEQLDTHSFFRANRQLIINIMAVEKAESYFKGRLLLRTKPETPGDQVISSSKAAAFRQWLEM